MVRDVKITVLKTSFNKELAEKFAGKDFGPCPQNYPGKVYLSKGGLKPEGLCDDAWIPMERFVKIAYRKKTSVFEDCNSSARADSSIPSFQSKLANLKTQRYLSGVFKSSCLQWRTESGIFLTTGFKFLMLQ